MPESAKTNTSQNPFEGINWMSQFQYAACVKAGWYTDLESGEPMKERNVGEQYMLMVSELVEGYEGVRKETMDDHLPHRLTEEVELADTLLRIFDYAGSKGLDLEGALQEKSEYNRNRADHKMANRQAKNGKKF